MAGKIRNRAELLAHGKRESKEIVLDIAEKTLKRLDGYHRVKELMSLSGSILTVGRKKWDLSKKKHVYLVGAGKACNAMAMAVDEILWGLADKGDLHCKDQGRYRCVPSHRNCRRRTSPS